MRTLPEGPSGRVVDRLPADIKTAIDKVFTTPFLQATYNCQELGFEWSYFSVLEYLVGKHGFTAMKANALALPAVAEILARDVAQKQKQLMSMPPQLLEMLPTIVAVGAQSPATGASAQGEGDGKKQRGRPKENDPADDRKIADAWSTGCYSKYADLEREFNRSPGDARRAIDRHRKRERLANESPE